MCIVFNDLVIVVSYRDCSKRNRLIGFHYLWMSKDILDLCKWELTRGRSFCAIPRLGVNEPVRFFLLSMPL